MHTTKSPKIKKKLILYFQTTKLKNIYFSIHFGL